MKAILRKSKDLVTGRAATFVVMARALGVADRAVDLGATGVAEAGAGAGWDATLDFFDRNGFGGGWAGRMRAAGHRCFVVAHADGRVVAGSWLAYRPEWVYEIGYAFDPGPDGCYVFGDFVEPAMRGRWYQLKMARHRLKVAADEGRGWTYGIVWEGNAPSLRNCERSGMKRAAKVQGTYYTWWQRDRLERLTADVPCGRFLTRAGAALGPSRWRRRHRPDRADAAAA